MVRIDRAHTVRSELVVGLVTLTADNIAIFATRDFPAVANLVNLCLFASRRITHMAICEPEPSIHSKQYY